MSESSKEERVDAMQSLPKVLILGDSISIGYTGPVRERLEHIADVVRPQENCQHTGHGLAHLRA